MELLLIPVPLFDKYMTVQAYLFRYQIPDTAGQPYTEAEGSPLLDALNAGGLMAFAGGKPLFVPIQSQMLLSDLDRQCRQPNRGIVFLSEDQIPIEEVYLSTITYLQSMGYGFSLTGHPRQLNEPDTLLGISNYLLLPPEVVNHPGRRMIVNEYKQRSRDLSLIAIDIDTPQAFVKAMEDGIDLFGGQFYQVPVTIGDTKITPLKANLIHLLNIVRDENFEFYVIAGVVQRDPALSLSLMRFVNSPYIGVRHKIKTIQHAVTVLGQLEVRKWVTAAVFRSLGTDQPGELTRISLIRAKFAENLAECFHMKNESQSLFLMGLFSLMHMVLDTTMDKALEAVSVSDDIYAALAEDSGLYFPVKQFIQGYERADWSFITQQIQKYNMQTHKVYDAYLGAAAWYNELVSEKVRPVK